MSERSAIVAVVAIISAALLGLIAILMVTNPGGRFADCQKRCDPLSVAEFQPSAPESGNWVCRCNVPGAEVKP